MRLLGITAILLLSAAPVLGAPAGIAGFASGTQSFSLEKGTTSATLDGISSTVVGIGDAVEALASRVQVALKNGASVLLDRSTRAQFLENGEMLLEQGASLASFPAKATGAVRSLGLRILPGEGSDERLLHVRRIGENVLEVGGLSGTHLVEVLEDGSQLAVVGAGDLLRFIKTAEGWQILPIDTDGGGINPQADSPIRGNELLNTGALNEAPVELAGIYWWTGPIGLPIAVAGGALLVGSGGYVAADVAADGSLDVFDGGGLFNFSPDDTTPGPPPPGPATPITEDGVLE